MPVETDGVFPDHQEGRPGLRACFERGHAHPPHGPRRCMTGAAAMLVEDLATAGFRHPETGHRRLYQLG